MRGTREIISVGIDIGTTTTQIVFSRLAIAGVAGWVQVPRLEVGARCVLYQSPLFFTPLVSAEEVDVPALVKLVRDEYEAAGFRPQDVDTGAVIITGEIARTHNAEQILQAISALAGDFVVTVAGPKLEAQIAGKGSSAAQYSADHFTQVTNVDIGGGTANAAIFRVGKCISSAAIAVGGRQIVVERASGIVRHIAPAGQIILEELGLPLQVGRRAELEALQRFCDCMADLVADLVSGVERDLGKRVRLTPPLEHADGSRVVFFSGGVAAYYYEPVAIRNIEDALIHDDVGPLLAQSLRRNERLQAMHIARPSQTIHATVIGAASQTVTLSGSTIWVEPRFLPLRNLPVIRPPIQPDDVAVPERIAGAIRLAIQRGDPLGGDATVAIALDLPDNLDFQSLCRIAEGIVTYADSDLAPSTPVVLVIEEDYAKVLGQIIRSFRPHLPLICIDQVRLSEGDFIDIGEPAFGGRVVPVSVKTLVFLSVGLGTNQVEPHGSAGVSPNAEPAG